MRYYYNSIDTETYTCDHPLYDSCTLYRRDDKGLAVVQNRYNQATKLSWWGPIDIPLIFAISSKDGFDEYFDKYAGSQNEKGLYPTVTVRKIMWALKMKPLSKNIWEQGIES